MTKTYNAKPGEIERLWYVVDAEGKTLGRLATQIADTLRGKLLGFNDLLAGLLGAALALAGGVALDVLGVAALAIGATVLALAPAFLITRVRPAAQISG